MEFSWKSKEEIPTERWERNDSISPEYFVKCGYKDGRAVIGYSRYSYAANAWMICCRATEDGLWDVQEWSDVKL